MRTVCVNTVCVRRSALRSASAAYALVIVAGLAPLSMAHAAEQAASAQPAATQPAPTQAPAMGVHASSAKPADTRDGRVSVGGVMISRSRLGETMTTRSDGAIEVPRNTIGPGLSLQQRNERISADTQLAQAQARLADRLSTEIIGTDAFGNSRNGTPAFFGSRYGGVIAGVSSPFSNSVAPAGISIRSSSSAGETTGSSIGGSTIATSPSSGFENDLHGQAQREFTNAASAGTSTLGTLHLNAIRQFGQNAAPQINTIEANRANAQLNIRSANPPQR